MHFGHDIIKKSVSSHPTTTPMDVDHDKKIIDALDALAHKNMEWLMMLYTICADAAIHEVPLKEETRAEVKRMLDELKIKNLLARTELEDLGYYLKLDV